MGGLARRKRLTCSFCGNDERAVNKLIAGRDGHICGACVALCNATLEADGTPAHAAPESLGNDELLATLRPATASIRSLQHMLQRRVDLLRDRGVTWEQIGKSLGVTRQAAWERFAP